MSFRPDHQLTPYRFYPVAERVKTSAFRWRNAARSSRNSQHGKRLHLKSVQRKNKDLNPIGLKFLKVLKTSFKKFSSRVWDRVPRSSRIPDFSTPVFNSLWKSTNTKRREREKARNGAHKRRKREKMGCGKPQMRETRACGKVG